LSQPGANGQLRILQIMRAPVGGLFRHVADLTRALDGMGHEVGIVVDSLASDAQTETRLAALAPHTKLGIHRLPMPRLLGPGDLTTPLAVRSLAKKLEIDILHGHGAKGGFYARLARIGNASARALYTPHGGVLHFSASSASGKLFHRLERWLMPQTAAIIFESAFAKSTYSRLIGTPSCPVAVIHNGVAPEEFVPVPTNVDAADFVFVGELRDLKGIFPLVEAMTDLTRPDGTPATLVMAGDGPDRAALETRLAELNLASRVSLVGAQPARTMFARGKTVVVPSLAESLPYIVLEAAAARKPLITTNVGGIPEIFAGETDLLLAPGDAGLLSHAMQSTLDTPAVTQAQAEQRRERIAAQFAVAPMSAAIEQLYRTALSQS
jgi:glycosyltransferase involved in cell wall biosynthesis